MQKLFTLILSYFFASSTCFAQESFVYNGQTIHSSTHNLYVCDKEKNDIAHGIFCQVREALEFAQGNADDGEWTNIYISPSVYWIDDPDDKTIRKPIHGSTPFGMEVKLSKTRMIGLGSQPEDVVIACNRGQTQGAEGNFTMLHITGSDIEAENITFGNYCNVDLNYKLNPSLNRKRRGDAIVQAQLIIAQGDRYKVRNCRFISRLNLCPFVGPSSVVFDDCYFESTDDALCGTGIYRHCKFTFFSGKPFYCTSRQGAVLMDCDIHSLVNGKQHFTKVSDPLFLIDCRITSEDPNLEVTWTSVPKPDLVCYVSNLTLNGKKIVPPHSVDITDKPLLRRFKNIDGTYNHENLPTPLYLDEPVITRMEDIEEPSTEYVTQNSEDGLQAIQAIYHMPSPLPRPKVTKALKLKRKGNIITAHYALDLNGHRDVSDITWYRRYPSGNEIVVAKSNIADSTITSYTLTSADNGCDIIARLTPESNRSKWIKNKDNNVARNCEAILSNINAIQSSKEIRFDLSSFPTIMQPKILQGAWTVDAYKPSDIADYPWTIDTKATHPWYYGKGVDGAAESTGLVMNTRGARLMYTPIEGEYNDMALTMELDPCKTAGQGFGSATGQYLDICIKFDASTMSGYGIRFIRTPYLDKSVEVSLIEYSNGETRSISAPIVCNYFKPGCTLELYTVGKILTAAITNKAYKNQLILKEEIRNINHFGGIHIQHTGSIGASATVIKSIMINCCTVKTN